MAYLVNPPSKETLRQLAVQRMGATETTPGHASAASLHQQIEAMTIRKLEVEIQNEFLEDACNRLDLALSDATGLYEGAPIALVSVDAQGSIVRLNQSAVTLLGRERHALLGHAVFDLFEPTHADALRLLLQQSDSWTDERGMALALKGSGHAGKPLALKLAPLARGHGHLLALSDCAAQQAQEDALRSTTQRWKRVLEGSTHGIWEWEVASGAAQYSSELEHLYGYPPGQFGSTIAAWHDRVHPQDQGALQARIQQCLAGQANHFNCEHRVHCQDGHWKWVRCHGAVFERNADLAVTRMVGSHTDLSRQKTAQDELRQTQNILMALLESLPQYLAVLDGQGRVLQTNALWNAYGLGIGHAYHNGFANAPYADLLDGVTGGDAQTKAAVMAGIADVIEGKAVRFELDYGFPSCAEWRHFSMQAIAVQDSLARVVVSHQEVTRFAAPSERHG